MRAVILSHRYVDPARRGKLHALAAQGADVRVAVPEQWVDGRYGRTWSTGWQRGRSLEIAPVRVSRPGLPQDARWRFRDLARLIRDFRPDVVQVDEEPTARVAVQAVRAARLTGAPVAVFTWENLERPHPWLIRRRRRWVLRAARGVMAASQAAAHLAERVAPKARLAVIARDGVDIPHRAAEPRADRCTVGFIGRLVPEKGPDLLLRALANVTDHRWQLVVVGDGPEREPLELLASRLHLASRIRWLGAVSDGTLGAVWDELDLLVVPSRATSAWSERSGGVAAQGMAYGIPVTASKSGALPEVVGDAGMVVPEGDVEALAAAIAELVPDAARRATLGHAARARAIAEFSYDAVARRTLAFWGEMRQ